MSLPEVLPSRAEVIERVRGQGKRILAVLPIHYPRALLRAHGFHPIELWGPPQAPMAQGARHFQAYTCDIVVKATSFLLSGGADAAEGLLIPHTCDAMQGMAAVLGDFVHPRQRVLTLYHPRERREADRLFYVDELARLGRELEEMSGLHPSEADWAEALGTESAATTALADLYRDRMALSLSDREFYTLVRSREFLPSEDFIRIAGAVSRHAPRCADGVPILLSGIVPEPMSLFDAIHDAGASVVADDLACGYRRVYDMPERGSALERLAAAILDGPADPTRGTPLAERADELIARMKASGARGMLVYGVKFCEPELFDLPRLRHHLGEAGFPMTHIEHELVPTLAQQAVTRIEAFVETLQ
jgi:benzoyl-CoA reductase/2-hydroxyglutaryl-CoA dehydratase subunit BcrC/BadD/HgdB